MKVHAIHALPLQVLQLRRFREPPGVQVPAGAHAQALPQLQVARPPHRGLPHTPAGEEAREGEGAETGGGGSPRGSGLQTGPGGRQTDHGGH